MANANPFFCTITCGGLCPGLNNVIRAVVLTLWTRYAVREIVGFRYGYRGLRYDSPVGAIRLEVGWKLDPVPGQDREVYFLSIGNPF